MLIEPLDGDLGRSKSTRLEVDRFVLSSIVRVRLGSYVADVVAASSAVLRIKKTLTVCASVILFEIIK